jgi:hypothetical protein
LETKIPFGTTDMDYVFICQVVGASAFVEPVVSEGQIPSSVWAEWENKTLGLAEWRREFQAVEATDEQVCQFRRRSEGSTVPGYGCHLPHPG